MVSLWKYFEGMFLKTFGIFAALLTRFFHDFFQISDVQLAIFSNIVGVMLFLLVVGYHYIAANSGTRYTTIKPSVPPIPNEILLFFDVSSRPSAKLK
jgi:hypothetical protein